MRDLVRVVFLRACPTQMVGVDASKMPLPTRMRCLRLSLGRRTMCGLADQPMGGILIDLWVSFFWHPKRPEYAILCRGFCDLRDKDKRLSVWCSPSRWAPMHPPSKIMCPAQAALLGALFAPICTASWLGSDTLSFVVQAAEATRQVRAATSIYRAESRHGQPAISRTAFLICSRHLLQMRCGFSFVRLPFGVHSPQAHHAHPLRVDPTACPMP